MISIGETRKEEGRGKKTGDARQGLIAQKSKENSVDEVRMHVDIAWIGIEMEEGRIGHKKT